MARKAAWEDMADADLGPYGKSQGTRWGRVFAGVLFVGVATFVGGYYLPLYRAHEKLAEQYRELGTRSQALSESVNKVRAELKATSESRDQLQAEHDARETTKKSSTDQQEQARAALASKLERHLKKNSAALVVSAGSLFVVLDNALLFFPQKLELAPAGRSLLCDVAKTSGAKSLTVRASVAEGSAVPSALAASHPGAWALSAGRAAAIAQALEQSCAFPATQLSATGNGTHHPIADLKLSGDPVELEIGFGPR